MLSASIFTSLLGTHCSLFGAHIYKVLSAQYGISFWAVPSISTAGATIATQLGNPTEAVWFTSVYTLALTVGFLLCGANSYD